MLTFRGGDVTKMVILSEKVLEAVGPLIGRLVSTCRIYRPSAAGMYKAWLAPSATHTSGHMVFEGCGTISRKQLIRILQRLLESMQGPKHTREKSPGSRPKSPSRIWRRESRSKREAPQVQAEATGGSVFSLQVLFVAAGADSGGGAGARTEIREVPRASKATSSELAL